MAEKAFSMVRVKAAISSPVAQVLRGSRNALVGVGIMSGIINLLMLTGAIFMMQVYDRAVSYTHLYR